MVFNIQLFEIPIPNLKTGDKAVYGEITIGDFNERFSASMTYWTREDYLQQWMKSIGTVVGTIGNTKGALVTNMYDPAHANFISCWPLYKEGEKVYIRNQLLFLNELPHPFLIEDIAKYIGNRVQTTDDGNLISEWETTPNDLKSCLKHLEQLLHGG